MVKERPKKYFPKITAVLCCLLTVAVFALPLTRTGLADENGTIYYKIGYAYRNIYDRFCTIFNVAYFFGTLNAITRIVYLLEIFSFLCLVAALILAAVAVFSRKSVFVRGFTFFHRRFLCHGVEFIRRNFQSGIDCISYIRCCICPDVRYFVKIFFEVQKRKIGSETYPEKLTNSLGCAIIEKIDR